MKKVTQTTTKVPEKKATKSEANNKIEVFDIKGNVLEQIDIPAGLFNVSVSDDLLSQYVRVYLNNQRQGTQSTKTRSEVTATTKKVYKQKGTGRARHGSEKGPIFVGGGITHAPKPRDYSQKINKKQRKLVLLGSLTLKFKQNEMIFVNGLLDLKKTREVSTAMNALHIQKSCLVITPNKGTENISLSSRNIPYLDLASANTINAYEILQHKKIIMSQEALTDLQNLYKKNENK